MIKIGNGLAVLRNNWEEKMGAWLLTWNHAEWGEWDWEQQNFYKLVEKTKMVKLRKFHGVAPIVMLRLATEYF